MSKSNSKDRFECKTNKTSSTNQSFKFKNSGDKRSGGGGMNLFSKSNKMLNQINNNNKLNISSINIRSLNSSIEHLEELMLNNNNIEIDILCLQETRKIDLEKIQNIQDKWLIYSYDYKSQYGGTCIMIKNNNKVKRVTFIKKEIIKKIFIKWKDELDKDDQFKGTFKDIYLERFTLCKVYTNNNKYLIISLYQYTNEKDSSIILW